MTFRSPEVQICQDGLLVLLSFSVARGSVSGMLKALLQVQKHADCDISCGALLRSMVQAKDLFWKKQGIYFIFHISYIFSMANRGWPIPNVVLCSGHNLLLVIACCFLMIVLYAGHSLLLTIAGCDGGQKEETSAPHNVLTGNWNTAQPYLSSDGITRVNMFFQSTDYIQLTKVRIKVEKGPRGPKCGMIFVYKDDKPFQLQEHVDRFKGKIQAAVILNKIGTSFSTGENLSVL